MDTSLILYFCCDRSSDDSSHDGKAVRRGKSDCSEAWYIIALDAGLKILVPVIDQGPTNTP